jgi:5'-nucleotidase
VVDARVDARGQPYYWLGFRRRGESFAGNTDLTAVLAGKIAVTPLQLDLTDRGSLRKLKAALS